jgi:OFA family oxalate/formate antiporter-like MFS transporter
LNRWVRLASAVVAMVMIGNLQYAWTLFVQPMISATGWKLSEVQWGFTFFIALMTWAMPLSGWLIDRLGPRLFMSIASVLCGIGWGALGYASSLTGFYMFYSIAGLGNAFVYCCSISVALKWFPDKRGLASGIIAAGYGAGAALFIPIFAYLIRATDYRATLAYTGFVLGIIVFVAGQFLKNPPRGFAATGAPPAKKNVRRHDEEFNTGEMLRKPQFYVLYVMMLMIGIGGLMATAQVAPVARNFGVGATALAVAMSLNPLCNGVGRIFWGWFSDQMGRERTMFLAFSLQAVFLTSVVTVGRWGDVWFVLSMALVFVTWGELYVLFPAVLTDIFGARNAASNYSVLYSTKGLASILAGGLAARLFEETGTWNYAFYGSAVLALFSAIAALAVRRMPLPKKQRTVTIGAVAAAGTETPRAAQ